MSSYTGTADRPDKAKAIAAVVAVHAGLAVIILTGLNVRMVSQAVERLKTFDVREPPPPPPKPPPPAPRPQQSKAPRPASRRRKPKPRPIVAPPPQAAIPVACSRGKGRRHRQRFKLRARELPAAARAPAARATGPGGGGYGDYSRFTPARRITRIPNREYRRLAATGMQSGSVGVTIRVNPDGSVSNCRVARSSGDGRSMR